MKHTARGFTLIELLVTVAIVAILASVAVPLVELNVQRTREHELRTALRQIRGALDAHKRATDEGRVLARTGGSGYPRTLSELVDGVSDAKSPTTARIYFLRRLPRDPFNTDRSLSAAETWGLRAYSSPPDTPAEGEDVYDVYSRSGRTGLNGQPYRGW
ncbi:MAG: type II secretion system protein [Hydrogenophaga sp.]|nr:type II secretion system protein [Hydrogenophaga sp.]